MDASVQNYFSRKFIPKGSEKDRDDREFNEKVLRYQKNSKKVQFYNKVKILLDLNRAYLHLL